MIRRLEPRPSGTPPRERGEASRSVLGGSARRGRATFHRQIRSRIVFVLLLVLVRSWLRDCRG